MAMKISNTPHNPSIRSGHGGEVKQSKVSAGEGHPSDVAKSLEDRVSLTETASSLSTLIDTLAPIPVVDKARVDELKAALADGSFQVDATRVAEKLIRLEEDL